MFTTLGKNNGAATTKKAKRDIPVNIAMRLDHIEMAPGKASLFHGFMADGSNAPVVVRLMQPDEAVSVNLRKDEKREDALKRLQDSYIGSGDKHRPRPAEIANPNHKTHCETGGLLMFTKCVKKEDGTYAAHWVETLEKSPGAGCDKVMATVRIEDIRNDQREVTGTRVVADVIRPDAAVVATPDNALQTMMDAFNNRNGEVKLKPFMLVRVIDAGTGKVVCDAQNHAKYDGTEVNDPDTGAKYTEYEAAPAGDSVKELFNPEKVDQSSLISRVALFGLGNKPGYPDLSKVEDVQLVEDLKRLTDGVRSGALKVEIIPGERIAAGPSTLAGIVKMVKSNPKHPMNTVYVGRDPELGRVRQFCDTFLTTQIGRNGQRFFTKALPADLYPEAKHLRELATVNDFSSGAEAAKERAAVANAAERVVDESEEFDPSQLGGAPDENAQARMLEAAQAPGMY